MNLAELRAAAGPDHLCVVTLQRLPRVERAYTTHKQLTLQLYASLEDFVLCTIFKCSYAERSDGKRVALAIEAPEWACSRNAFPYTVGADVEHWILWRNKQAAPSVTATERKVRENFGRDAVWFINLPTNRSVPGLHHAHVFVRKLNL
jgi:hypothetical protein